MFWTAKIVAKCQYNTFK